MSENNFACDKSGMLTGCKWRWLDPNFHMLYLLTAYWPYGNKAMGSLYLNQMFFNIHENKLDPRNDLGPVVQSIVSLTSPLSGQFVKCFMTL